MADQKPISESFPKDKEMATAHEETAVAPGAIASEAKQAADAEQNMTVLQAIKAYPKAIAWSVLLSSTLIMEGYDLALLGNLYGMFESVYPFYRVCLTPPCRQLALYQVLWRIPRGQRQIRHLCRLAVGPLQRCPRR